VPASLFDSNLWIAAIFTSHPAYRRARHALLETTPSKPAIFCRATEQSFLRLASNPSLLSAYGAVGMTNRDALIALKAFLSLANVCERSEPPGLVPLWERLAARETPSPKVWMDAYLASFAIAGGLRMVTLDRDFKAYESHGLNLELISS